MQRQRVRPKPGSTDRIAVDRFWLGDSVSDIEGGPKRRAQAYEPKRLLEFLRKLDADNTAKTADLPDLIRFLFGTGARFGEALAVRWCDCNLTDKPVWVIEPDSGKRKKLPPRSVWLRERIGYPDFVTHFGRKTVATVLAESGQTSRQIADQLRHSSIQTTEQHYIERGLANPAAAALLDAAHRPAI